MTRLFAHSWILAVVLITTACDSFSYDPPPQTRVLKPANNVWYKETPYVLQFTEAINPDSLVISIYTNDRDYEQNRTGEPILADCHATGEPCDDSGFTLTMNEDNTQAIITFGDLFFCRDGIPYILVVHAGLADEAGRTRNVEDEFAIQVTPESTSEESDLVLQTGVFALSAQLPTELLGIWLHIWLDVVIDPATGTFVGIGSYAKIDIDGEAVANETRPQYHVLPLDNTAWAVTFDGFVQKQTCLGGYLIQSNPFDMQINVLGSIPLTLNDFTLSGTLFPDGEETENGCTRYDGRDVICGSITASSGSYEIVGNVTNINEQNIAFVAHGASEEEIPEGMPRNCMDDPCAAMTAAGGDCQLPIPWAQPAGCTTTDE